MIKKIILLCSMMLICFGFSAVAQKTIVKDVKAKTMLMGKHKLSLQWISWDYFGTATVTNKNGVLFLKGEQRQKDNSNFLKIDGKISRINSIDFTFVGTIIIQIDHINGGQSCTREGEMTFRITGKRRYWRLMEMDNPCDSVTDYVDLYFR